MSTEVERIGTAARRAGSPWRPSAVRLRIWALGILIALGFVRLAVRAAELQIRYGGTLQAMADEQQRRTFRPPVWRGPITDRNGSDLALTVYVDSIFANPREIEDPAAAARSIARVLDLDARSLDASLREDRSFVWVKRLVRPAEAAAVRALKIPGIDATREPKRFYPGRTLAAQLIGFVGYDSVGLEGLEHQYDAVLRGRPRVVRGVRDGRGQMVLVDGLEGAQVPQRERVELAIDRTIQHIAEQELEAAMRAFEGVAGSVVVMDPRTGEVLAVANAPTFDPNLYSRSDPAARRNRAVADRFEPGSTMKPFAVAALLDAGLLQPDEEIYCEEGVYTIGDYVIRDSQRNEWLTLTQCLQRSSNVCLAKLAAVVGKRRMYHTLRRFGFGERTGAPVPGETMGLLRHYTRMYEVDLASLSFGQGISVSNLQLATAMSAIANGGVLLRPIVVRRVIDSDGRVVQEYPVTERRRAVDARTARLVTDMLTSVTETGGTGTEAAVPGFSVAGKTGTAQKADPVHGGYYEDRWTASFVGFVPADRPRIVVSVVVDEPLVNHYGGIVAAPVFRRVADRTLRYLGVAPEHPRAATAEAGEADVPESGALTITGVPLALPRPGEVEVPEFHGETIRAALGLARDAGLGIEIFGEGLGVEQWPKAGAGAAPGTTVRVRFSMDARDEP